MVRLQFLYKKVYNRWRLLATTKPITIKEKSNYKN